MQAGAYHAMQRQVMESDLVGATRVYKYSNPSSGSLLSYYG